MALAGFLNVRKNGATLKVPLFTAKNEATPSGCPAFCVRRSGSTVYAAVSAIGENVAACFRRSGRTYYLVTGHTIQDVKSWTIIYNKTSGGASSYTLPAELSGRQVRLRCGGGRGANGGQGGDSSRVRDTNVYGQVTSAAYSYGGRGGYGGNGGTQSVQAGICAAGTVFSISLANGGTGGAGGRGGTRSGSWDATGGPSNGGGGGAGGTGYRISVTNAAGQSFTCTGYGGGGGGGGGGVYYKNNVFVSDEWYWGNTGAGGRGGNAGNGAGGSAGGGSVSYSKTGSGVRSKNGNRANGYGGNGGSAGSSGAAYAIIEVGVLQ